MKNSHNCNPGSGTAVASDDVNLLPFQILKSGTSTTPSALKSPPHHPAVPVAVEFVAIPDIEIRHVHPTVEIGIPRQIGIARDRIGAATEYQPLPQVGFVYNSVIGQIEELPWYPPTISLTSKSTSRQLMRLSPLKSAAE